MDMHYLATRHLSTSGLICLPEGAFPKSISSVVHMPTMIRYCPLFSKEFVAYLPVVQNYEPIWYMDLDSLILIADTIVGNGNNPCANKAQGVNGEVEGMYKTHSYYAYIMRWHDD